MNTNYNCKITQLEKQNFYEKSKKNVWRKCPIRGVYKNLKFIFFPNPPFFFLQFCIFLVNWGINKNTFYPLGVNMHFPPFFHPFSIIVFPNLLFCNIFAPLPPRPGGGVKQKNIHPCVQWNCKKVLLYLLKLLFIAFDFLCYSRLRL